MTAVIGRVGFEVDAIDVFCGFGGSSQGIHAAGATVLAAANHNALAIECHSRNFPETDHWRADLVDPESADYRDPAELPRARFAWFSPACTHHSQANAQKAFERGLQIAMFEDEAWDEQAAVNSERSRVTMSCVLRYCERNHPEIIVVENVVEVTAWGPGRDGSTFRWWYSELEKMGYEIEPLFLNSQFFPPCPQSRDRIYIVAWRKGNQRPDLDYRPTAYCDSYRCGGKIVQAVQTWKARKPSWTLPKVGKYGRQYVYTCPECRAKVEPAAWPAYTAINWGNLGLTLDERKRPLAPQTVERIRRGLAKFRNWPPIVIPAKAVWGVDHPVTVPFATQSTQQDKALVAMVVPNRVGAHARHVGEPAQTVVAGNNSLGVATQGITLPAAGNTYDESGRGLGNYVRARPLSDPLFTQHTTQAFGFAHTPFVVEMRGGGSLEAGQHPIVDPTHGVTAGGLHHGLTTPGLFAKFNGGAEDTAWHHMAEQLGTVTGRDTTGMVILPWFEQFGTDPVAVTAQFATLMSHRRHALASIEAELVEVTDEDLGGVRFRMLEPDPELRAAMAFAPGYILLGTKTQMTSGLGNAVTPPVASWITARCLETLWAEAVA